LSRPLVRGLLYAALGLAFVLHNDLWLWNDAQMVGGLPVGLVYHVVFCLAVAGLMWALVRFAWPQNLEADPSAEGDASR
jgi:hypothetical protein